MEENKIIFGRPKVRFGNVWAYTSRMVLYAEKHNLDEVLISSSSKRLNWIQDIWKVLDTEAKLVVVDRPSNEKRRFGVPDHRGLYAKTKKQHDKKRHNRICYQFDSDAKNHPSKRLDEDYSKLINFLNDRGCETVKVGLPLTISEIVDVMENCDYFLGICSGMAHIAHSVGIPKYLKKWHRLDKAHVDKEYETFKDIENLIEIMAKKYG